MTVAVRKLRVEDAAKLQALVVENFDAIEQGLTVLDSRLLLGHATVDVLGMDSSGALVLGAIGFTANEEMLLKAVEAYSWCLEYPESLVRLYPSCELSDDRPPRLLFVVERVPDAFHRKIKQLGFPEVDCVEVRHLEFDGVPAIYFETLLRLRRSAVPPRHLDTATAGPAAATVAEARPVARAAAPKLPKMPAPEPPATPRAPERAMPAPAVSTVTRQDVSARVEAPRPAPQPVILREPEPLAVEPEAEAGVLDAPTGAAPDRLVVEAPLPSLSTVEPTKVSRDVPGPALKPVVPSAPAAAPSAAIEEPRVSFKDLSATRIGESSVIAAEEPKAPAPQPAASEPARPQIAVPQEFAGLNFPNDGVLTRQWMDFLNQMSNSK